MAASLVSEATSSLPRRQRVAMRLKEKIATKVLVALGFMSSKPDDERPTAGRDIAIPWCVDRTLILADRFFDGGESPST